LIQAAHSRARQALLILGQVDGLPAPQRRALLAAFGMTDAAVPDLFLAALAEALARFFAGCSIGGFPDARGLSP
jgi:hypothetical protein